MLRGGEFIGFLVLAYLFGSWPFGYRIAKWFKGPGFDIRNYGSNNIGFTNVYRTLGPLPGFLVLTADILKGLLPVYACKSVLGEGFAAVCLLAAALGHVKSIYFYVVEGRFSGGKAVATLAGGAFALQPLVMTGVLAIFLLVLATTRYLSLASLIGAYSAVALSNAFGLGLEWNLVFAFAAVLISVTHWRNIVRLWRGTERRFVRSTGEAKSDEIPLIVFVIHPTSVEDLNQSAMSAWLAKLTDHKIVPMWFIRWITRQSPVLELDEQGVIEMNDGSKVRPCIWSVPLLPSDIKALTTPPTVAEIAVSLRRPEPTASDERATLVKEWVLRSEVMRSLQSAAVHAERRGVKVMGLGALLSTFGNGGGYLQEWAKAKGLKIVIDNGAANTAASVITGIEDLAPKPLSECVVATVGASGFIGTSVVRALSGRVGRQIAIARDERKLRNLDAEVVSTTDLASIVDADVVIFTTSSARPIITAENVHFLKCGAVIHDNAIPHDVDDEVLSVRPDLTISRSGLILPPGDYSSRVNFHFGTTVYDGKERQLFPACLIQAVILGATGQYEHASCGAMVRPKDIEFFRKQSQLLGFQVIVTDISEPEVFAGASS